MGSSEWERCDVHATRYIILAVLFRQKNGSFNAWPYFSMDNKHCSEILQETLLNSVSNDLLPFMVGQSHDSLTQLRVKDVMLFQNCQQAIQVLYTGHRQYAL
jgi:hypothetical protein